jgi:hypothetical protein
MGFRVKLRDIKLFGEAWFTPWDGPGMGQARPAAMTLSNSLMFLRLWEEGMLTPPVLALLPAHLQVRGEQV